MVLNQIPIFGGLTGSECALIRELLEERAYEPGTVVIEEGTSGKELYVIDEGQADVLKRAPDGHEVTIRELGPGACFGEMALVGIMRRSATVRARTALRALRLSYASVGRLAEEHPRTFTMLVMNLARELCRRLQVTDAMLAEFGLSAPSGHRRIP
jgi:CRP-like cAMP-binding protein